MNKSRALAALGVALLLSLAANIYFGGMSLGHMRAGSTCDRKEWREKEAVLQDRLSPQDYAVLKKHKQELWNFYLLIIHLIAQFAIKVGNVHYKIKQ